MNFNVLLISKDHLRTINLCHKQVHISKLLTHKPFTMPLAAHADLPKKMCLYSGADWLKLVCQSQGVCTQVLTG